MWETGETGKVKSIIWFVPKGELYQDGQSTMSPSHLHTLNHHSTYDQSPQITHWMAIVAKMTGHLPILPSESNVCEMKRQPLRKDLTTSTTQSTPQRLQQKICSVASKHSGNHECIFESFNRTPMIGKTTKKVLGVLNKGASGEWKILKSWSN